MSTFIELWRTADFEPARPRSANGRVTPLEEPQRMIVNTEAIRYATIDPETSETVVTLYGQGNFAGPQWCVSASLEQISHALGTLEVDYSA